MDNIIDCGSIDASSILVNYPTFYGRMTEWLGGGLQILSRRFDSYFVLNYVIAGIVQLVESRIPNPKMEVRVLISVQ